MPVFSQGYRAYRGRRKSRILRWWPITRTCLRNSVRWPFIAVLIVGAAVALALPVFRRLQGFPGGLFVLGYQFVFLAAIQATPGMIFLGLSLSDRWGDSPLVEQVVVRVLVSVVSAAAFGLGYAWAVFHRRRQTWHDWAASTLVIRGSARARRAVAKPLPRRTGEKTYRVG